MTANKHLTAIKRKNRGKRTCLKLEQWLDSLTNSLKEVTALEINTTIVEEITTEQFIPWQVYQEIYIISRRHLQQIQTHPALCDRYLQLRRQLELVYSLLLLDPHSELYDSKKESQIREHLTILSQSNSQWENLPTQLPEPIPNPSNRNNNLVFNLLRNYDFLRTLRQLGNLKQALDRQNQILQSSQTKKVSNTIEFDKSISAQTKIQLDGKIINRYSQEILAHPHQANILELHQNSINLGERQWRLLLDFIVNFVVVDRGK